MATNAQLSAQMNDLLTKWNVREDEMRAWLAGVPTGGPNNDGRYPLTNEDGTTYLIDCPAKLEDRVGGPAAEAELARQLAEAARDAALSHKDRAVTAETSAAASQVAAKDARDLAKLYRDEAAASHSNATVARTGAEAARDAAAASEANASTSETNAKTSEDNAKASEDAAAASAAAAATFNPSDFIRTTQRAVANGIATLDANGKIVTSQLPGLVLVDTYVVANEAGQLAAPAEQGDVVIRTDLQKSFIHTGGTAGTMADYQELLSPTDAVGSVDGRTGTVTLGDLYAAVVHGHAIADVSGLQAALDGKAAASHTHVIADVTGLQGALDGKQPAGSYAAASHTHSYLPLTGGTLTGPFHVRPTAQQDYYHTELASPAGAAPSGISLRFHHEGSFWQRIRAVPGVFEFVGGADDAKVSIAAATVFADTLNVQGTDVMAALNGKADATHTHAIADVTGLQSALNAKAEWNHGHNYSDLAGIPATFAPSPHTHSDLASKNVQNVFTAGDQCFTNRTIFYGTSPKLTFYSADINTLRGSVEHDGSNLTITNNIVGNINLTCTGAGTVRVNGFDTWHTGNFTPSNYLPLTGGTLTGQLALRNGADSDGTPASAVQIGFQYRLGGGYEHRIVSKHNAGSSALNALDFYLWTPSTGSSMNAPTLKAMSLDAASGLTVASNLNVQGNRTDLRGQLFVNGTNPEIYLQGDANSYYPRIYFSTAYGANSSYLDAYNGGRWTSFNGAFSVAKTDGTITLSVTPSGSSLTGDLTVNSQNIFLKPDANNSLRLHHNGSQTYIDTTGGINFRDNLGNPWLTFNGAGLTVSSPAIYANFGSFGAFRVTNATSFDYTSDTGMTKAGSGAWVNTPAGSTGYLGVAGSARLAWHPSYVAATTVMRAVGWYGANAADPNGLGVEMGVSGSIGYIYSYNRTASAYGPLRIGGTSITLEAPLSRSGQGGYLHHASSSLGSGAITVSTAAPSGGADGDIWLQIS